MARLAGRLALVALLVVACRPSLPRFTGVPNPPADAWPAQPMAVLIEHNPWLMVIGSDTPRVEVFTDGTVLRLEQPAGREPHITVGRLTPKELAVVQRALTPRWYFWRLKEHYDIQPNVTDMITTELIVRAGSRTKRVAVYGYSPEPWTPPASTVMNRVVRADRLPREFDRLCKTLLQVKVRNTAVWAPRYVEVMIWPYDHSPEEPLPWPSQWPDLDDRMAFQRGDSWSLILPGADLEELRDFLRLLRERQAVEIGGKKWSISYRPVMPGGAWAQRISRRAAEPAR